MTFVWEDFGAVGYVELGEVVVELVGVGGGDDVVGGAVEDEGGREAGGGLGGVGLDEAAGDVDEGAEAGLLRGVGRGGELGGESEGEEGAEGDAGEDDAGWVDVGAGGGEADGFVGDG